MAKRKSVKKSSKSTKAVVSKRSNTVETPETMSTATSQTKSLAVKIAISVLVLLIGIFVIDLGVQVFYNSPAALVNNKRITYAELDKRLRQSYGVDTVENLINEELVLQEGQKAKVAVTDESIQKEYNEYVKTFSGGEEELLSQLKEQGVDKAELLKRIKITLTVNKLVEKSVKAPTDQELQDYYAQKYSYIEEAERPKFDEVKKELIDEVNQQNIQAEIPAWLEKVRAEAKIKNNLKESGSVRIFGLTTDLFKSILPKSSDK